MAFHIKQEKFEGPLELLVELVEKEKLSISEVSLAKVADEYLVYIKSLGSIDPEQLAQFLVVAAELMLIKSRSLLPGLQLSLEEEHSVEDLERRLAEYKRMRELAKKIKEREGARVHIYTREAYQGMAAIFYPPPKITGVILRDVFAAVLASIPKLAKLAEEKVRRIISLEEKVAHIKSFLQGTVERAFSEIVGGAKEKVDVIISFLALLELARQKFLSLDQQNLFEDIRIKKIS